MILRILFSLVILAASGWAQKNDSEVLSHAEIQRQRDEGQILARQLRSATPTDNFESSGVLIIGAKPKNRRVPVIWKVEREDSKWKAIYEAKATAQTGAEKLVITHSPNGPNEYSYAKAPTPTNPLPSSKILDAKEILQPFAGSDFSIADLGVDFLFWPEQRKLPSAPGDLRLGQECYILESSNPNAPEIVRVKSYIDKRTFNETESVGILDAEAFDAKHRAVKEFTLGGSDFTKINGQWRVEKMEMQNKKTNLRTVLKLDLPAQEGK